MPACVGNRREDSKGSTCRTGWTLWGNGTPRKETSVAYLEEFETQDLVDELMRRHDVSVIAFLEDRSDEMLVTKQWHNGNQMLAVYLCEHMKNEVLREITQHLKKVDE
jgi:hypothetical protein